MTCSVPRPFTGADQDRAREAFRKAGHNGMRRLFSPSAWLVASAATLVVDVGSFEGVDLMAFMQRAGPLAKNVTVHTFEPVKATRLRLQHNVGNYSQIHIHPYALGDSTRAMCTDGTGDAATMRPIHMRGTCMPQRRVHMVDTWHVINSFGHSVDLLQLNCEGCELAVLHHMLKRAAVTRVVKSIEVQFHRSAVTEASYCTLDARLRALGYTLEYRFPYVWERWTLSSVIVNSRLGARASG